MYSTQQQQFNNQKTNLMITPGTILKSPRLGYSHYGVYTQRGTVIDLTQQGIKERSIAEFCLGNSIIQVNPSDSPEIHQTTLARAFYAQRHYWNIGYDLFKNNCEHFANWCKTGNAFSTQVKNAGNALLVVFVAFVVQQSYKSKKAA